MKTKARIIMCVGMAACLSQAAVGEGSSIAVSLVNPGGSVVLTGTPVTLEVQATFDTRLSAVAFELAATGTPDATMTARGLSTGLTAFPLAPDLPHDLKASSLLEVAYDNDFDAAPGGASDGLAPGTGVVIETITLTPTGTGTLNITLSNVRAAHTITSPNGSLFNVTSVGTGTVQLSIAGPGDADGDGDIDLDDFALFPPCMTGPEAGPVAGGCNVFDFDTDDDVDLDDFAGFQQAFTG